MNSVKPLPRRKLHRFVFLAAGIYNIAWGLYSVWDPQWLFRYSGLPRRGGGFVRDYLP